MPYRGHVENGVVVLDEPVALREGIQVSVELLCSNEDSPNATPLRGTEYRFDDPFTPVVAESGWDALR
jgi:hypothetical protein